MTLNQITKVKGPGIHTQANIVSNSISLGGIATASNFKTGTTNVHNVGIEIAGINVLGADTPIGTGATIYDAGGAVFTGVVTATSFSGSVAGTADLASGLTGTPDIAVRNITGVGATFTGNVSIGGTLTYEDVTNIDSVGLITARDGLKVLAGGANVVGVVTASAGIKDGTLTPGRVVYAGAGGKLSDDADLTYDGTTLSATGAVNLAGPLVLQPGGTSWSTTNNRPQIQRQADGELRLGAGSDSASNVTFYTAPSAGGTLVEKLRITSAGKMGLGNNNPGGMLHINNTGQVDLMVGSTNAGGAYLILDGDSNGDGVGADYSYIAHDTGGDLIIGADNPAGNADLIFKVGNNAEAIRVKNTGKVGINQTSPTAQLQIGTPNTTTGVLRADPGYFSIDSGYANGGSVGGVVGSATNAALIFGGDGNTGLYHSASDTLNFTTAGTERLRITSGGGFHIGLPATTNAWDTHAISLTTNSATFACPATVSVFGGTGFGTANMAGGGIRFVGYYDSSNFTTFAHVAGVKENTTSGNYAGALTFHTRANGGLGAERLRIDSTGRLLLGSTRTYSDATWYDDITINNSGGSGQTGGTGITLISSANSWGSILFGDNNDNNIGAIKYDHNTNSMRFVVNTIDPSVLINSSGDVGIGESNPGSNNEKLTVREDIAAASGKAIISIFNLYQGTSGQSNQSTGALEFTFKNHNASHNWWGGRIACYNTDNYNQHTYLSFDTANAGNASEKMRLTNSGSLRIGDAATHTFSAHSEGDDLVIGGAGWRGMTIYGEGGGGVIQFADNGDNRRGQIMYNHGDDSMNFRVSGNATKLKITSGGNIKIGHNNTSGSVSGEDKINIKGDGTQFIYIGSNDASGAGVYFDGDSNGDMSGSDYARIMHNTDGYLQLDNWKSGGGHRWSIGGNTRLQMTNDGSVSFTGASTGTIGYQLYNATGAAGADTRLLIKTYANYGADPYIKFDSGGSNMIVGQLYAGTTNNKLVLGVGESPSGGVSGIHIAGDGNTQVTNYIYMSKASDPRIYAGSGVGLNIDGQALYLNRHTNSSIAMANGGGPVSITNTVNADTQLNIYKQSGIDTNQAILRIGYDSNNCLQIYRVRNNARIVYNTTQNDAHHVFKTKNGNDALYITERQSVHAAKFSPQVIRWGRAYGDNGWNAGGYYKFIIRYSTGNFSGNFHFCRMITQHDWGHADWEMRITRDYYNPTSNDKSVRRVWGYYADHGYQWQTDQEGLTWDPISRYTNLGPGGAHKIHESSRGGYYRDAYATDYSINIGQYTGVVLEITVYNPGGWIKDAATSVTDIYPASFTGQASQSDADNWSYGRGLWFNARSGFLQHWGSNNTFGSNTLPSS